MTLPDTAGWWAAGETFFAEGLAAAELDLDHPSLLPGWSRRTLVAHVARNADALRNLLTWARTGVETPMYPSPQARETGITESASQLPAELVDDAAASAARLAVAVHDLPVEAWHHKVRTAQGRAVAAAEVVWMRCREVWVHTVDLDARLGFADVPDAVLVALLDDVVSGWARRGESPSVVLTTGDHTWGTDGPTVDGPLSALAGLVTGRTTDGVRWAGGTARPLPRWL